MLLPWWNNLTSGSVVVPLPLGPDPARGRYTIPGTSPDWTHGRFAAGSGPDPARGRYTIPGTSPDPTRGRFGR
jgi:hypothetical protein